MKRLLLLVVLLLATALSVAAQEPTPAKPSIKLAGITLLVKDYDEAAKWYADNLGFDVRDNKDTRPGKRWVSMSSKDSPLQIFLLKPGDGYMPVAKELPMDRIGHETFWIVRTDNYDALVAHLKADSVTFRSDMYPMPNGGKEIVVEDLYGNLWVLQQIGTAKKE